MNSSHEPRAKKGACQYCGDAPVNHTLSYVENLIMVNLDAHTTSVVRHAPRFIKDLATWIPVVLFKIFSFFNLAKLSSDIDKAASFRSRIIWEEARKRGIEMRQIILFGKNLDHYHAIVNGKSIYFESIPIPPHYLDMRKNWDDKLVLKKEFSKHGIPVPLFYQLPFVRTKSLEDIFSQLQKPVIIKPQVGSRARHTMTNIATLAQLSEGVRIAKQICPYLVIEEHLDGYVCRATFVDGVLAGFYRGQAPFVTGDGEKSIGELIVEKDNIRPDRVEKVRIGPELYSHISRFGFTIDDIPSPGMHISLTHHVGRLFGGSTKEMLDELHPSFIPILEKAAQTVGLGVAGFDCIIPDPTKDASSQRWGIIECNTLPFIDLHYYALEGKPRNIAGMIWDMWK